MNAPIHSIKSLWFCPLEVEFAIFFCPELCPGHCTRLEKPTAASAHAQCVMGWLTMWKANCFYASLCNCIGQILKEKLNQWLLLLIISLLNLICLRTVAKLTSIMPMSSARYSLWIIVCCAITYTVYCVRQANGTRVRWSTRIFHNWPCWPRIFSHNTMPLR